MTRPPDRAHVTHILPDPVKKRPSPDPPDAPTTTTAKATPPSPIFLNNMAPSFPSSTALRQATALAAAFAAGAAVSHVLTTRRLRDARLEPSHSRETPVSPTALLAAVELGGTSCRVAIAYADDPTVVVDEVETPTTEPHATIGEILRFLRRHEPFAALGVASFGPIDLDKSSDTYGFITTTPKLGWQQFDLLGAFSDFRVPVGFDTDVNAPALAEQRYGGHENPESCAYVTVGTGIGVGLVVNAMPVHGLVHPEGGHVMTLRKEGDTYPGWLHIHRLSTESMASARACAERTGVEMADLASVPDDHAAWDDIAYYLAQLCITITYMVSPHVIVLSGGVMKRTVLFDKIRRQFEELNEGYIAADKIKNHLDKFIVPSAYGNQIGIIGAIELARRAAAGLC